LSQNESVKAVISEKTFRIAWGTLLDFFDID
jgi:hypothetical protein